MTQNMSAGKICSFHEGPVRGFQIVFISQVWKRNENDVLVTT